MGLTMVFNHDCAGKIDVLAGALDAAEDRSARVGKGSGRSWSGSTQGKAKRKFEFTAHSGNAANNVGAIDGIAVPSASGNHGSFDPNQMGALI
jgi:hypothetical protein